MRPPWGRLESGRAGLVWNAAKARFSSQVLGPHFEELCRRFAATELACYSGAGFSPGLAQPTEPALAIGLHDLYA